MSMSTPQPGGDREPLLITRPAAGGPPGDRGKDAGKPEAKAGGRSGAGRTTAKPTGPAGKGAKGGTPSGRRPAAGGGGKRPVTPVKVTQGRSWGPIALWTAAALIVAGILGFGTWQVYQSGLTWEDKAGKINGLVNYRKSEPDIMKPAQHAFGPQKYKQSPPVGGTHNPNWQNCMGDVYDAPIASEHAVHSMEHGAVWVTYRPDLPKDQVEALAKKVRGNPYMLMSPYEGLDKPISVQTWGYQLKVDNAGDPRIDAFIKDLRQNASVEPGAVCSGGITLTGTTPHDLQPQQGSTGNGMGGS
jgi:hypothetical protein